MSSILAAGAARMKLEAENYETRIAALEAENARLHKRVAELEEALEPFARHIDEMKFDIDNNGNPFPDDQAVGWVYVTNGDFRAARRALEAQGGE